MSILASLVLSFAMFSRIPMPQVAWNAANRRWALAFLPMVGAVVGGGMVLWNALAQWLGLSPFLRGTGFALVPLLITGGIHMDGFCDTIDALASHAGAEKKQEILQDPRSGAFAVMGCAAYLLAFAALGSELPANAAAMAVMWGVFVLSRCLSGLGIVLFPIARSSGLAHSFASAADKKPTAIALALMGLLAVGIMVCRGGAAGAAAVLSAAAVFLLYRFWLVGRFGGLSGDLAGWFVQVCELCALAGLVVAYKVLALI